MSLGYLQAIGLGFNSKSRLVRAQKHKNTACVLSLNLGYLLCGN
ncbi:hypothetical protein [Methylomonas albis]|nr:hypothetical protein [Methylomonas albis]